MKKPCLKATTLLTRYHIGVNLHNFQNSCKNSPIYLKGYKTFSAFDIHVRVNCYDL